MKNCISQENMQLGCRFVGKMKPSGSTPNSKNRCDMVPGATNSS